MTQSNLEKLLKIDNESYNLLRVLNMFMKLDRSQEVPLQAIAVFWFFIIVILQYKKYYNTVLILLFIGMILDLIITISQIGEIKVDNLLNFSR